MGLERILIAHDPSVDYWDERLFTTAVDIAESAGTTVFLLNLFSEEQYEELRQEMNVESGFGMLSPDTLAERVEDIQSAVDLFEESGIEYEIRGVSGGNPAQQIVQKTNELDIDLVLVSGAHRSPTGKALFGDLAQDVLLDAPVPVVYVRRDLGDS
jgi:nucleotide-binding universal stress UspA family protein